MFGEYMGEVSEIALKGTAGVALKFPFSCENL